MSGIPAIRRPRTANVREDWSAWLPAETSDLFEHLREDLAISSAILGIIVNEALAAPPANAHAPSAELAPLFVGLFDRSVCHLGLVLGALEAHGRQFGTLPHAAPLRPEHFRSHTARQVARACRLRSTLRVAPRSPFWLKLGALRKVVTGLHTQAQDLVAQVAAGKPQAARNQWARLEILQYDLNTCLQETIVVLKSFFCALPGHELPLFRERLPV